MKYVYTVHYSYAALQTTNNGFSHIYSYNQQDLHIYIWTIFLTKLPFEMETYTLTDTS